VRLDHGHRDQSCRKARPYAGSLENAAAQENFVELVFGISQGGMGPFLYRMALLERI
jgi:hypothetical protein